jgi:succinyl-CoA synthetase beta subunit
MISDAGGRPANFCEMGGLSNADVMNNAMEIVLSDKKVKVLLISLIGGLTRMDEMAEGICRYVNQQNPAIPMVIRMCGTKADAGIPMLKEIDLTVYEDLAATVRTAVAQSKGA